MRIVRANAKTRARLHDLQEQHRAHNREESRVVPCAERRGAHPAAVSRESEKPGLIGARRKPAGNALVAVGLPHHHGVGVGDLAGRDNRGLGDDGGDGGHGGHGDCVKFDEGWFVREWRVAGRIGDFYLFPNANEKTTT
jgi:hypothetical protein|tara:strand:- start:266 stop:682 length:417 start_codon:yes stop_codon:yes gene_type:complete